MQKVKHIPANNISDFILIVIHCDGREDQCFCSPHKWQITEIKTYLITILPE